MTDRALDWNDDIENDGGDFTVLPAGEYPFKVVGFERSRYGGGDKLPPCNKAIIEIQVDGGDAGSTTIKENLFLHSKTEGILCAFFRSIGQRKSGEKLTMDWKKVPGSEGIAKIGIREYTKDGEKKEINQVKQWLDPKPGTEAPATETAEYADGIF